MPPRLSFSQRNANRIRRNNEKAQRRAEIQAIAADNGISYRQAERIYKNSDL